MKQIQIVKSTRTTREQDVALDLRTPGGRILPY
jgi:hypothetical protein